MVIERIVFLDDLLRDDFIHARAFIYTLIAESLRIGTGASIPDTREYPSSRGLDNGFELSDFRRLCKDKSWMQSYWQIPRNAISYLGKHIPRHSLAVGYEMPPWLLEALNSLNIPHINIRLSPLRFARDLYLALSGNIENFRKCIDDYSVTESELRIEAGLMCATIRHNEKRRTPRGPNRPYVIFIGQTQSDASLINRDGVVLKVEDFAEQIRNFVGDRKLLYKPHPYGGKFAKHERRTIEKILNRRAGITKRNTYGMLASREIFDLVAISSGVLQEAKYFNRNSKCLFQHVCNLDHGDQKHSDVYIQIRFLDFLAPSLWARIIGNDVNALELQSIPNLPESLMRRLHSTWWGYSDFLIDNDVFWHRLLTHGVKNTGRNLVAKLASWLPK